MRFAPVGRPGVPTNRDRWDSFARREGGENAWKDYRDDAVKQAGHPERGCDRGDVDSLADRRLLSGVATGRIAICRVLKSAPERSPS